MQSSPRQPRTLAQGPPTRTPTTSFVVPVRDGAATLIEALASIVAQTDPDWEAIVVDDGSTDGSADVARRVGDPRIRVLQQDPTGIVAALNIGLAASRGRFVARMDADDRASPDRLALQRSLLEGDPSLVVVDGRVVFIREDGGVPAGMQRYAAWINAVVTPADFDRELSIGSCIVHPAATLRRAAVVAVGGYRDGAFPEDYDLWCRLHAAGGRFRKVPRTLVWMRDRPDRLTRTDPRYGRDGFRRVRQSWLAATHLATPRRVMVVGGGREGRAWVPWLLDRGHQVDAWIDVDPKRIGTRRLGIDVQGPTALGGPDVDLAVVAVSAQGRGAVRALLASARPDWREGSEAFFVSR